IACRVMAALGVDLFPPSIVEIDPDHRSAIRNSHPKMVMVPLEEVHLNEFGLARLNLAAPGGFPQDEGGLAGQVRQGRLLGDELDLIQGRLRLAFRARRSGVLGTNLHPTEHPEPRGQGGHVAALKYHKWHRRGSPWKGKSR